VVTPTPTSEPPTPTVTAVPTPVPGQQSGTIYAPKPVVVSSTGGQNVNAGAFSYVNNTTSVQQIHSAVVTASNPAALASLTLSVAGTNQSVTVSPVTASNTFNFNPPVTVGPGQTVAFAITAQTANSLATAGQGAIYAALLGPGGGHHDGGPLTPLGGGLLMVGLMLMPLGNCRRRQVALIALGGLMLAVALAGCGSSNGSNHGGTGTSQSVIGGGPLANPITLSTVSVNSAGGSATSVQQLTAIGY